MRLTAVGFTTDVMGDWGYCGCEYVYALCLMVSHLLGFKKRK